MAFLIHNHSRLSASNLKCTSCGVNSKGGDNELCVLVKKKALADPAVAPIVAPELGHDQSQRDDVQRRLKMASILCLIFLIAEIAGGLISGSLAILSDAAHLFSDLMGFVFAIAAGKVASMPGSRNYTFGYRRWEVIAALFSMLSLAFFSVLLEAEGIRRLCSMIVSGDHVIEEIDGRVMSAMAFIGVIINVSLAFILGVENHVHMPGDDHNHDHSSCEHKYSLAHSDEIDADVGMIEMGRASGQHAGVRGNAELGGFLKSMTFASGEYHNHEHSHSNSYDEEDADGSHLTAKCDSISRMVMPIPQNINMHAAYLHVLGDLVQSIAVLIAGLVIMYKPEWKVIDPILSIVFCPLIFYSTLGVIRTSMQILLEGTPSSVNVDDLWSEIAAIEGVTNVTNLHVWSISHGIVAMTVHARAVNPQSALHTIHELCTNKYGIDHCTIQIEDNSSDRSLESTNTAHFYVPVQGA